jgi:cytochrome c oxidase cbb3-type subunit III
LLSHRILFTVALACLLAAPALVPAQGPPAPAGQPPRPGGGFIPGQQRPTGDPAAIERGNKLYGITCRGCHGADLRGGDMGGPNLLRSLVALADRNGEGIGPIILNGQRAMPPIQMSQDDAKAVATYVRSVLATIGSQGKPPSSKAPPSILVGNAKAGQAYFDAKCAGCHSASGDLKGIATRIADPKMLQNTWVAGGRVARFGPPQAQPASNRRTVTATVTQPSGETAEGKLMRIDDFFVTIETGAGAQTFRRDGAVPTVVVHDPMKPHRDLLAVYSDDDIHNVTAYLVTLK